MQNISDLLKKIQVLETDIRDLNKKLEQASLCGVPSERDRALYGPTKKMINLYDWLKSFANNPSFTILEVGSREVASKSRIKSIVPRARYIGFDVHEGANVDLVGDAHKLSDYIPHNTIDIIISFAVFEHLAMPWVVAEEYSKILKVGGYACTFTHFSFSEHEVPWHFFQYNNRGLEVLFSEKLGFSVIESGMGMPMVGRFAIDNSENDIGRPIKNLYCSSYIFAKKNRDADVDFQWRAALSSAYGQTEYPKYTGLAAHIPNN